MTREVVVRLLEHGIRPSAQRISIMEYMLTHHTHPTVDAIYHDLVPKMPTLSRTTIYNTLRLLAEHKAISELSIDRKTAHFDGDMRPHSHFRCNRCGRIIDMPLQRVDTEQTAHDFVIEEAEVYYRGYCRKCMEAG